MQDNKLIKDIKTANPDIIKRKIERWGNAFSQKLWPFVKEHYWHSKASVNVFRVVGTQHPDYAGFTWIEFLEKGKRMGLNLKLQEENPGYYYETGNKEPVMYYNSIDGGDLYVGGDDGNHRTCIARAVFYLKGDSVLHGVTVNDYRIDWRLKGIYDQFLQIIGEKKLPYFAEPQSEVVSRDDSGGWMLEKYKTTFKVKGFKRGKNSILDGEEIGGFLESVKNTGAFKNKIFGFFKKSSIIALFTMFLASLCHAGDLPANLFNASAGADKKVSSEDKKDQSANSYHKGKASGWYWYQDPIEESKEEEKKEEEKAQAQPNYINKPDPWLMTADELKKFIEDTKKDAVATPTPDNLLNYIAAQDVARKKAAAFAASYMLVMQMHPEYSTVSYNPSTNTPATLYIKSKTMKLSKSSPHQGKILPLHTL
ncbi:MAG: conjugal transfer protein TraF [Deltaproteobacteria bacterium]|nr:conjugal transfer protein TraF [Deltaproteobacteria bacterium]